MIQPMLDGIRCRFRYLMAQMKRGRDDRVLATVLVVRLVELTWLCVFLPPAWVFVLKLTKMIVNIGL